MYVDSSARHVAAKVLRDFLAGRISNMELDKGFPERSRDPAIHAVYRQTFGFQDDIREFHATGPLAVGGPTREVLDRCVSFLETGLPYEWPMPLADLVRRAHALLTRTPRPKGDRSVWPFFRRADLASAQQRAQGRDSSVTEGEEH
ncbi:MAG TPA: hypothetical protein VEB43_01350 [Anaeromyxobacter sp.]|nr:hypothetical protein [Anaeromyxobacter sp.]